MKRTPLRRKSKNPQKKAKDAADNALQESYRRNYPNEKCESCGNQFKLMHHHIMKSMNTYARYKCPANLIFLCEFCHNQIHFYNNNPISTYSIKRGQKWIDEIKEIKKRVGFSLGIKKLKNIEKYYLTKKPKKYDIT